MTLPGTWRVRVWWWLWRATLPATPPSPPSGSIIPEPHVSMRIEKYLARGYRYRDRWVLRVHTVYGLGNSSHTTTRLLASHVSYASVVSVVRRSLARRTRLDRRMGTDRRARECQGYIRRSLPLFFHDKSFSSDIGS